MAWNRDSRAPCLPEAGLSYRLIPLLLGSPLLVSGADGRDTNQRDHAKDFGIPEAELGGFALIFCQDSFYRLTA